jgi:hypothetical protein
MFKILRLKGWQLNDNDTIVNNIIKALERNNGECPCNNNIAQDKHCPCSSYRAGEECCCGLYKRKRLNHSEYNIETNDLEGD